MDVTTALLSLVVFGQAASIESRLDSAFRDSREPGAVVVVLRNGHVLAERDFGVANVKSVAPMKADTSFEIGSLSKQFTATAVLMLCKTGKLRLDEAIGDVLPDLPSAWKSATILQILHHQSGIPDYETIAGYDVYNAPQSVDKILGIAQQKAPAFSPGAKFEYSNTGYFLLSLAVQKQSGMAFGEFLERKIFRPLKMSHTLASTATTKLSRATGYHVDKAGPVAEPPIAWSSTLGAGGIVSLTLGDFAKWDGKRLYGDRILPKDLRSILWTPSTLTGGETVPYGAGFFIGKFRGETRLFHSGETNGFSCM